MFRGKRHAEVSIQNQYHTNAQIKGKAELEYTLMAQNQSRNSSSNKVAKHLRDRRYRQIVIKNKKAYDRKKKIQSTYRDSEWDMS